MKVQDYELYGLPVELRDMLEEIKIILNEGRYQFPVETADASGTAEDGTVKLIVQGASVQIQIYYNGTWYEWEKTGSH